VPLEGLGLGEEPLELGFGDLPYQINRRTFHGADEAVRNALISRCRECAAASPAALPIPGSAEERLLKLTADMTPVAEAAGDLRIFAFEEGLPLVVGTMQIAQSDQPADSTLDSTQVQDAQQVRPDGQPPDKAAAKLGARRQRVVVWGLAAPAGDDTWNLYVAHAQRTSAGANSPHEMAATPDGASHGASALHAVPIPPGSRRSLAVRDYQGGSLSAFAGHGRAEDWVAFYGAWFRQRQWKVLEDWHPADASWLARYEQTGDLGRVTVDLQIATDGGAGLIGLISTAVAESSAGK
jgi:hypothetical protein